MRCLPVYDRIRYQQDQQHVQTCHASHLLSRAVPLSLYLRIPGPGPVSYARQASRCCCHPVQAADSLSPRQSAGKIEETVTTNTDVLVVGGGTAGTIAAIQSARAGAKTVLIERGSQLGGTMTTGGVSCRCSRVCSSIRSWPWNTRKYMRKLYRAVTKTPINTAR